MNSIEIFKTGLRSLAVNKSRSVLTVLGVVIGVFAVVVMVALGTGIQNIIGDRFSDLGTDLIIVAPGTVDFGDDPSKFFSRNKLSDIHVELIKTYASDYVAYATPTIRIGDTISYKTNNYFGTVNGTNSDVTNVLNVDVTEGRMFTKAEERNKTRVAVVGSDIKNKLFGQSNALGEFVEIEDEKFEIIGLIDEGNSTFDDVVIIPYTVSLAVFDVEFFSSIGIKAKSADNIDITMRQVELALLRDLEKDDFSVLSQTDLLGSIQSILGVVTAGLGAIAGISLLVGGIGIMNIMLVSVTERIKEIGLRKAVGASSFVIGFQFVIEAVVLSVFGGLIGILLAWLTTIAVRDFVRADISMLAVVVAFSFSVLVGVVFGTYPAIKASKLDPIEALRKE